MEEYKGCLTVESLRLSRPYMKLYVKELLQDPHVMAMPEGAFGVYVRLFCYNWCYGGVPRVLADLKSTDPPRTWRGLWTDPGWTLLGPATNLDGTRLRLSWDLLRTHFRMGPDGQLWNKRVLRELERMERERSRSGRRRRATAGDVDADADADAEAPHISPPRGPSGRRRRGAEEDDWTRPIVDRLIARGVVSPRKEADVDAGRDGEVHQGPQ